MLAGLDGPSLEHDRIEEDISRTYLDNPLFSTGSSGRDDLGSILRAVHHFDASLGLGPGVSHVAGLLMTHVASSEEAFWILTALVKRYGFRSYFENGKDALGVETGAFAILLDSLEPALAKRFVSFNSSLDGCCLRLCSLLFRSNDKFLPPTFSPPGPPVYSSPSSPFRAVFG